MRMGLWVILGASVLALTACDRAAETAKSNIDHAAIERARAEMQTHARGLDLHAQTHAGRYPATYDAAAQPDPWGNLYVYTARGKSYELRSLGPDGEPDTKDDIVMGP